MNILVTGGLGVNGAWVTRQLLEQGHRPVVYENRLDTTLVPDIKREIDIVIGDIQDLPSVVNTVKEHKIECICHLAALMLDTSQANPWLGFQVNAAGTVNVLEAARIMDVGRIVFTSSIGVYSPFTGEYGYPTYKPINEDYPKYNTSRVYNAAKLASELMCFQYNRNYGLEFVILRFSEIYGIGKRDRHGPIAIYGNMIENAMLGKPTTIPRGSDEKVDMVYVKDAANSIVISCFARNIKHHVYNIGTGVGYRLQDVADVIQKIYPGAVFNIGPGLDYLGFGQSYCVFDIARAKEDLGYYPEFTLEEGVRDYIESVKRFKIPLSPMP